MELRRYFEVLCKRWKVLAAFLVLLPLATLIVVVLSPTVYKSKAKLWVKINTREQKYIKGMPTDVGKYEYTDQNNAMGTIEEIMESNEVIHKAAVKLGLRDKDGNLYTSEKFVDPNSVKLALSQRKGVEIEHIKDTDTFEITGYSTDLNESAAIVNGVVSAFYDVFHEYYKSDARNARKVVEASLVEMKRKLEDAQKKYTDFRVENNIYNESTQVTNLLSDLQTLQADLEKTDRAIKENRKILETLRASSLSTPEDFRNFEVAVEGSTVIESYKNELIDLETGLAKLLVFNTREHPDVKAVLDQIKVVKDAIAAEIKKSYASQMVSKTTYFEALSTKYSTALTDMITLDLHMEILKRQIAGKIAELETVPSKEEQIDYMTTDISTFKDLYVNLVSSLEVIKLAETLDLTNAFMFQPPYIAENVKANVHFPRKKKAIAIAGVLAMFLGIAAAFTLEYLDGSVWTVRELEGKTGLRVAGAVFSPAGKRRLVEAVSSAETLEGIHGIAASLKVWKVVPSKTVSFVSTRAGEGKTTVALGVAGSLARMGDKVLLIDANLRNPSLHKAFAVDNSVGLADCLRAGGPGVLDAIKRSGTANLDILAAGTGRDLSPEQVLASEKLATLVEDAAKSYNRVIFDTASYELGDDPLFVSRQVEAVIMLVEQGRTSLKEVANCTGAFEAFGRPVSAFVFNKVRRGSLCTFLSGSPSRLDI